MILKFDFDLPCTTSPIDDVLQVLLVVGVKFLMKLVNKYQRKIHWKIYDEWFMNGGDI